MNISAQARHAILQVRGVTSIEMHLGFRTVSATVGPPVADATWDLAADSTRQVDDLPVAAGPTNVTPNLTSRVCTPHSHKHIYTRTYTVRQAMAEHDLQGCTCAQKALGSDYKSTTTHVVQLHNLLGEVVHGLQAVSMQLVVDGRPEGTQRLHTEQEAAHRASNTQNLTSHMQSKTYACACAPGTQGCV